MLEHIGTIELKNNVDITDPCYDKDVWCRMTTACKPGKYNCYIETEEDSDYPRVACISIFKGDKIYGVEELEEIGTIGVDAGLAGFFDNKKDFSREEWLELCDKIHLGEKKERAWILAGGFFSHSGYGDGAYSVYASKNRDAFTIVFIDDCPEFEDDFEDGSEDY